jgi:hypothetical protein
MGCRVLADDYLAQAQRDIESAIKCLNEIVVGQCDGHDSFSKTYRRTMRDSYTLLICIKDDLA